MCCCSCFSVVGDVDDGYRSLSSNCVKKRAAVRQLKLQMQQLEVQRNTSHQRIDAHVQELVVSSFFIVFSVHCALLHCCLLQSYVLV